MSEETDEADEYYNRLSAAIESSISNGQIVTKWVAVVEVIDEDGDKGLWAVSDENSTVWDTLGMLAFAEQKSLSKVDMVTWAQHTVQYEDDEDDADE